MKIDLILKKNGSIFNLWEWNYSIIIVVLTLFDYVILKQFIADNNLSINFKYQKIYMYTLTNINVSNIISFCVLYKKISKIIKIQVRRKKKIILIINVCVCVCVCVISTEKLEKFAEVGYFVAAPRRLRGKRTGAKEEEKEKTRQLRTGRVD